MAWMIAKTFLAAGTIAFTSWLAQSQPRWAGFIIALPLSSMLALAFNYAQFQDRSQSFAFAKSILVGVPLSLLFFVPFLFAEKLGWGFWSLYALGIIAVLGGFSLHSLVLK